MYQFGIKNNINFIPHAINKNELELNHVSTFKILNYTSIRSKHGLTTL